MKNKHFLTVIPLLVIVCCLLASTLFVGAEQGVAFLDQTNGNDANNGDTSSTALKTLDAAYQKLAQGGGSIVFVGDYIIKEDYESPQHSGRITLTSKYNGVEYNGRIYNQGGAYYRSNGSTVFADITLYQSSALTYVANFNPVVFDDGFKVDGSTNFSVVGGYWSPTSTSLPVDKDSNITINSGTFNYILGFTRKKGAGTQIYTGTSNITVNGGTIQKIYGGTSENHAAGNTVISINNGTVTTIYTGGDVTRRVDGSATVNLNGGTVNTVEFNNVIGDGTLNIIGTAPRNVSVVYKSDSLKQMAEKEASQKAVYYNSLVCSQGLIAQFNEYFDVVENSTFIYVGAGNGDGMSASSPMGSFAAAYEKLKDDGGTIIVIGEVKCDLTESSMQYGGKITVRGQNDSSALVFSDGHTLCLGTDTAFDNIKLKSEGKLTVYACYNALTVSDTVSTEGDISVVGSANKAGVGDVSLTLNGGTFSSVVGVNTACGAYEGEVSILLGGATVTNATLSNNSNAKISKASFAVSGGNINSIITCEAGRVSESLSMKVLGGNVGALTLKAADKQLFLNISHSTIGSEIKAEDIGSDNSQRTLIVGSDVDESKLSSIKQYFGNIKNGNFVYIADGANGTGLSPDSPISDINQAVKLLGGEGTVVVSGSYTINANTKIDAHSYPVTITCIGTDTDYRHSGAVLNFNANLILGGETTIEYIDLTASKSSIYIIAMANKFVIGDEVRTELVNANTNYINIIGGCNDGTTNGKTDVTVNSGDWGVLRAGGTNTSLYEKDTDINLTVNGGTFHKYVALASRGHINGKITFTANGGTFLQSVYAVYENDGNSYSAEYDVTITINGGEFHQEIAPAYSKGTKLEGKYYVIIAGGEFSHLTDLVGTEEFGGSMSSTITVDSSVDINASETGTDTFTNALRKTPDPWLFYHDGYYYYTYTAGSSLSLMKVANLSDLQTATTKVIIKPTVGKNLWSPEIHHFTAEEVGAENEGWYIFFGYDDGTTANQRAHVLKCKDGDNFFGDWVNPVTGEVNVPQKIDFPDAPEYNRDALCGGCSKIIIDGKAYITFVSEVGRGTSDFYQTINITAIENPWTFVGTPTTICVPEYSWEMGGYGYDSAKDAWYPKVVEGASAVYSDSGDIYLMYTGSGYWTKYYQLGYLTFLGGDPLDIANWKKNPDSILSLSDEVNGCGHGSYFKDVDGNYWVCYHGYIGKDTSSGRYSHLERIYVTSDGVSIGNGSGHPAPLDTVYTINLNPMPLDEKISGFAFKEVQSPENPFDNKDTDTNTNTGVDTGSDTQSPSTSDTPSIIVIVMVMIAAAVVVAGAAVFSIVKKKKPAATAANDSHVSGDDTDKK